MIKKTRPFVLGDMVSLRVPPRGPRSDVQSTADVNLPKSHHRRQWEERQLNSVSIRSARPAQCWARSLRNLAELDRQSWTSFPSLVDQLAVHFGDRTALISLDERMTYRALARAKNQYANWAKERQIGPGDTVCLLMHNCPSYLAIWLGVTQAGAAVALVNTNLRGEALLHSLTTARAKTVIVGGTLLPALQEINGDALPGDGVWLHGEVVGSTPWLRQLDCSAYQDDWILVPTEPSANADALALLIFTSGTTGLPKAARLSHYRLLEWSLWFAGMMDTGETDRLYNCLPMYHSTGGVAAIGGVLLNGGAVVIRERFSARRFWSDIVEEECTIFLYIGELCRYLTHAPADENAAKHGLRLCCGNGLRAEIWRDFQSRFRIPTILEFYASTEGNVSLYNCEGQPGAIGRVPPFLAHRFPIALIECDPETGEARRGADNRCIRCVAGGIGEAIGQIPAGGQRGTAQFEGYTDEAATERKILRDVFADGDAWFRTGDLMRRDEAGFFYFVDRMGDTFRWKSENVSTTQVSDVLAAYPGVTGAIVYGVQIPGEEGRACMAAVTTGAEFDLAGLPAFVARHLPPYARPMFLRLCETIETTGTFKPVKTGLVREGYDVTLIADPLFIFQQESDTYVKL